MSSFKTRASLLAIAVVAACSQSTRADLIEATFEGVVDSITNSELIPAPWDDVQLGDPWRVTYVFDTEAPDDIPGDPFWGIYPYLSVVISIGGDEISAEPDRIEVEADPPEFYKIVFTDLAIDGGGGGNIFLTGLDSIDNDVLPLDIELDDFLIKNFEIGEGWILQGEAQSYSWTAVPAPGSGLLILLGLGTGVNRRSRLRQPYVDRGGGYEHVPVWHRMFDHARDLAGCRGPMR